jgi:hypothetical protein
MVVERIVKAFSTLLISMCLNMTAKEVLELWQDLLNSLILLVTDNLLLHKHQRPQTRIYCCFLVAADNGVSSFSSGFQTSPGHILYIGSLHGLNRSSHLTNPQILQRNHH